MTTGIRRQEETMKFLRRCSVQHTHTHTHYVNTLRHLQNRKYITYRSAARGEPSHHGQRQHAQKFGEVAPCGFEICHGTDRQTDILTTIHCIPPGGEVIRCIHSSVVSTIVWTNKAGPMSYLLIACRSDAY